MPTDIREFVKFHRCLMADPPPGYQPHYIRLEMNGKNPVYKVKWKTPEARLTYNQALEWLAGGGNVGIAANPEDPLVNVDVDNLDTTRKEDVKPTLMDRSRSRVGLHAFYWCFDPIKIPNIPTKGHGEVRSCWEFVVAAGSYVPTDPNDVAENQRQYAGLYTVEEERPPEIITFEELPKVFIDAYNEARSRPPPTAPTTTKPTGKHSALFDITVEDIIAHEGGTTDTSKRWPIYSAFHDSKTGANMSYSGKLLTCWRDFRTFNALQTLTVLSGFMGCLDAGSPHKRSAGGASRVTGDDGAIFHAWLYAKTHGYLPQSDPIPVRALHYIAKKHLGSTAKKGEPLPRRIYLEALRIVEAKY